MLLCAAAFGCSAPTSKYLAQRAQDLADCFEAAVGTGYPAYVGVKASDFAVVGCGVAGTFRYGWHGRYGGFRWESDDGWLEAGIPLVFNREEALWFPAYQDRIRTWGPCFTTREYGEEKEPRPRGEIAEKLWIGASTSLVLSARVGVNPAELADFITGWFGRDILQDDDWGPRKIEAEKEVPKEKDEAEP